MVGSETGLRNVVVDLMLTAGIHNLEIIGKRCRQAYRKLNIHSVLVRVRNIRTKTSDALSHFGKLMIGLGAICPLHTSKQSNTTDCTHWVDYFF